MRPLLLLTALATFQAAELVELPAWTAPRKPWEKVEATLAQTEGLPTLTFRIQQDPKKTTHSLDTVPFTPDPASAGLRFEVKGDGSSFYGSVGISTNAERYLGYEAIFPLSSTTWTTVTLRWSDFVLDYHPGNKAIEGKTLDELARPSAITRIGFGYGPPLHKYYPADATFAIRRIETVATLPPPVVPATFSTGFRRTAAAIAAKRPLKILLLGDSITDMGGETQLCRPVRRETAGEPRGLRHGGQCGHRRGHGALRRHRPAPQPGGHARPGPRVRDVRGE